MPFKNESMFKSEAKPNTFSNGGYFLKIKTYLTLSINLEFPVEARCWKPAERTACDEIDRKDHNDPILEMHFVNTKPIHSPLPTTSGCDHLNLRALWCNSSDGKPWTPEWGVRAREVEGLTRFWFSSPLLFVTYLFSFYGLCLGLEWGACR